MRCTICCPTRARRAPLAARPAARRAGAAARDAPRMFGAAGSCELANLIP